MAKFKVGDRLRIQSPSLSSFRFGAVSGVNQLYSVKLDGDPGVYRFYDSELEPELGSPPAHSFPPVPPGDDLTALRDWFAGMAMQGMLGNPYDQGASPAIAQDPARVAQDAYALAGAMLAARAAKTEGE